MLKARILLVEDTKAQAKMTMEFLEKNGYEVVWAQDGASAMKAAKTKSIDVILLDLVLPDINGNEVCRWLKLSQDTKAIPIIMLTVKGTTDDKVKGLEAGADDYLPKPYSEVELNARIYSCLRTKALQDELRQKNRQLEDMLMRVETLAVMDPLTNLFNRRRFEAILEKEFGRTMRYESPLSCLMIDIDHFKKINDTFGHRAGDTVLREMGKIILDSIRDVDTAARWGGEEFMVLIPETPKEKALKPANRILEAVVNAQFPDLRGTRITVSIGIAGAPDPAIDSDDKLIHAADLALYQAKHKGRNRVEMA
jgi:diguanylate cyclase (GGDEF)-like protein